MYSEDGRSYQLRSTDNGQTWEKEGCVWDGAGDERPYQYTATYLSQVDDGEIVLAGFRTYRPKSDMLFYNEETGVCLPEQTIIHRSQDGGRSWSPPQVVEKPGNRLLEITGPVVVLDSGEWLIPFDTSKDYYDLQPLQVNVVGLISADRGQNWNELVRIAGWPGGSKSFWHGRIIKLRDGWLLCFPWTGEQAGQKFLSLHRVEGQPDSRDWSDPQPTGVPGQTSYPVDLGSGRMLLFYSMRDCAEPGIYGTASQDEGRSWSLDNQVQIWDATGRDRIGVPRTGTYPSSHDHIAFGAPSAVRLTNGDVLVNFWALDCGQIVCRWARVQVT